MLVCATIWGKKHTCSLYKSIREFKDSTEEESWDILAGSGDDGRLIDWFVQVNMGNWNRLNFKEWLSPDLGRKLFDKSEWTTPNDKGGQLRKHSLPSDAVVSTSQCQRRHNEQLNLQKSKLGENGFHNFLNNGCWRSLLTSALCQNGQKWRLRRRVWSG